MTKERKIPKEEKEEEGRKKELLAVYSMLHVCVR
jgi:hypothetical protein